MNSSFSFLHDYWMMVNVINNHFAFLARSLTRSLKMRSPVIRSLTWRPKRITSSRIQIRWITHDTPSWITLTTFSTTALEWFAGSKFRITHPYFCVLLVCLRCVDPVNREQETSVHLLYAPYFTHLTCEYSYQSTIPAVLIVCNSQHPCYTVFRKSHKYL